MPAAAMASEEACSECGGSGWLRSEEDPDRVRRCSCRTRRDGRHLLAEANIPPRYAHCTLAGFRTSHPVEQGRDQLVRAVSLCRRYVEDFLGDDPALSFRDTGLLFIGPPGVGKTHLAVAVLRELVGRYRARARFVDFTSLAQDLHGVLDPDSTRTRSHLLSPVESAEVLVVDELGAQKLSPWAGDVLYDLINRRYACRLPTLFTTNYRLDDASSGDQAGERGADTARPASLSYRIPAMLVSRLYEMAQPVLLDAVSDYRREVQAHQHSP